MPAPLELPVLQRWSCHNCGGCCRQHLIEITDEERSRIESQGWAGDAALAGRPAIVPLAKFPAKRWRLNHAPDGACGFLAERGLCRIHAKFGEAAKPLACRVYPYAFHPAGKNVAVSLRYSCPSVIANAGATSAEAERDIRRIAAEVVPEQRPDIPPPEIAPGRRLDWPDVRRFVDALDATFAGPGPLLRNLLTAVFWVSLADAAKYDAIRGKRLSEFLELVRDGAAAELPADLSAFDPPTSVGRMLFRSTLAQYARQETAADLDRPWPARWRNLASGVRFSRGKGLLPALHAELKPVPFAAVEAPFGLPDSFDELFSRYLRTKVRGMHFCGRAFGDWPVTEGFFALALVIPATLYLARWKAAGEGRTTITDADLAAALAIADHHHGYAPPLETAAARRRVRLLAGGDLPKLIVWYAR